VLILLFVPSSRLLRYLINNLLVYFPCPVTKITRVFYKKLDTDQEMSVERREERAQGKGRVKD